MPHRYEPLPTYYTVNPYHIVEYQLRPPSHRSWSNKYDSSNICTSAVVTSVNKIKQQYRVEISGTGMRRLKTAINWFYYLSIPKEVKNNKFKTKFKFKLNFITLTLPCNQLHGDKFVKSEMLGSFLNLLRKQHKVVNYIWKAEKTKLGNIHFHILTDVYIHYNTINSIWNKILKFNGYIDEYRCIQQAYHKCGFQVRPELLKHWSYENQKKAYIKGIKSGWQEPSGTTDIHSLSKLKNVRSYLLKYFSKNINSTYKDGKDNNKSDLFSGLDKANFAHPENTVNQDGEIQEINAIEGNIWFTSQSLSACKNFAYEETNTLYDTLRTFQTEHPEKVINGDYYNIYLFGINDLKKLGAQEFYEKIAPDIEQNRQHLYKNYVLPI